MSVAIWGLVAAKAKSGVEAAGKDDALSVGALVKKIGVFCSLIAAASLCQMMGAANTAAPVEAVPKTTGHKLQAEHHPASFYDKSSSHYQGGAHNVLINLAKSGKIDTTPVPQHGHDALIKLAKDLNQGKRSVDFSAKSMGGNHNVAMAVLAQHSNEFKQARMAERKSNSGISSMFSMFSSPQKATNAQF